MWLVNKGFINVVIKGWLLYWIECFVKLIWINIIVVSVRNVNINKFKNKIKIKKWK